MNSIFKVIKFITESPAGGLPLGLLVLSNHTEATLTEGLRDLKALMPDNAFAGRGKVENSRNIFIGMILYYQELGPKIIMTDDDKGEISSLRSAWPESTFLLCQWHLLQVFLTKSHTSEVDLSLSLSLFSSFSLSLSSPSITMMKCRKSEESLYKSAML